VVVVEMGTAGGRRVRLDDEASMTLIRDPVLVQIEAPVIRVTGIIVSG
jgi:hypothetical protein